MILDIRGPDPQHYPLSADDHEDETIKLGDMSVIKFQLYRIANKRGSRKVRGL